MHVSVRKDENASIKEDIIKEDTTKEDTTKEDREENNKMAEKRGFCDGQNSSGRGF